MKRFPDSHFFSSRLIDIELQILEAKCYEIFRLDTIILIQQDYSQASGVSRFITMRQPTRVFPFIVGKEQSCDIVLTDPCISR
jgi:pSer/pThr/pTyr-binding forkhead associated (FHA) protein